MKLARSLVSEPVVILMIVINAVALFSLSAPARNTPGQLTAWYWVDYFCVAYFVVELIVKLRLHGFANYWAQNTNRFDFFVIIFSAPALFAPLLGTDEFALVLVLRLGRIFRLIRLMKFIPDRDHMALGIRRAMRASVGVVLAVSVVNMMFALGAAMLFSDLAPQYFGTPFRACFSMFQVFTFDGWGEITSAIIKKGGNTAAINYLARGYFLCAAFVGGILGLSLVNAVFVDQMLLDNTRPLEAKLDVLIQKVNDLQSELNRQRTP